MAKGIVEIAVSLLFPNFDGNVVGDDSMIIVWESPSGIPQPSQSEIDAKIPEARVIYLTKAIRQERDKRLLETDCMMLPDYPVGKKPVNLILYRQALRDFPVGIDAWALGWPVDIKALSWSIFQF